MLLVDPDEAQWLDVVKKTVFPAHQLHYDFNATRWFRPLSICDNSHSQNRSTVCPWPARHPRQQDYSIHWQYRSSIPYEAGILLRLSGAFSLLRIRHVRVNPHNLIPRTGILVLTVCRVMRARISQRHASVSCLRTISFTTTIMSINYLIRDSLFIWPSTCCTVQDPCTFAQRTSKDDVSIQKATDCKS